jgi:ABC-type Fe3+/spermidine/putrescine transport system ATPase subunit
LRVAQMVGMKNVLPATVLSPACVRVGHCLLEVPTSGFAIGAPVYVCVRPERITLVRENRQGPPLQNVLEGDLVEEQSDGLNVSLLFRAHGQRLRPDLDYDLEIDTPVYVYERLNLSEQRHWTIAIKKSEIHIIKG